jgi:hypothetical protein
MNRITTPKAEVILDDHFSVRIYIHENASLEKSDLVAINDAKNKLVGGNRYTVLFVPGKFASITPEARDFSASQEVYRNAIAKAIVVRTIAHRLIGNFFIRFNRPPAPTLIFTDETEALAWLEVMRKRMTVVR